MRPDRPLARLLTGAVVVAALTAGWAWSSRPVAAPAAAPATPVAGPPTPAGSSAAQSPEASADPKRSQADDAGPHAFTVPAWEQTYRVLPVTLRADRSLVPPDDVSTLGWWRDGAAPDSTRGAIVLVVHRDSDEQGQGPFAHLDALPPGSPVLLDGQTYQLQTVHTFDKQTLPIRDVFGQHGPTRLVVVTCGGDFTPGAGWDSNIVATFTPA